MSPVPPCPLDVASFGQQTHKHNMTNATKRMIARWIHLIFSIPIIGYIYSPFENIPQYAKPTRYVFFPILALSGLWMWKGHLLRKLISKSSGEPNSTGN